MKHIIIGGVAGGATAAARIRRTDEKAEIFLLEKGKYISYANCGLPYYIGGTIAEREKLFMQTPASFAKRFNIDVRVENEVIGIDTTKKRVEVRRADGSTYTENYDKMLLSPGASPVRPPLKGIEIEGIFTLRNIEDTDRIKEHISSHRIGSTVIVGAGFIGLEMAENLHRTIFQSRPMYTSTCRKKVSNSISNAASNDSSAKAKRSRFSSLPEKALQPI